MSDEYPLYPELTEAGKEEAQLVMDRFKKDLHKAASGIIGQATEDFYYNCIQHVESDSWTNYRNQLVDGLCNYSNNKRSEHDYMKIRRAMFEQYREEIIKDLNQDLVKEVAGLKETIELIKNRY